MNFSTNQEMVKVYIVVTIAVINIAAILIFFFIIKKKQRVEASDFKNMMKAFGLPNVIKTLAGHEKGEADYEGVRFGFHLGTNSERGKFFKISMPTSFGGSFEITKKPAMAEFMESIKAGSPRFGQDYAVMVDPPELASQLFSSDGIRLAVRDVFEAGVSVIRHSGRSLEFEISPFDIEGEENVSTISKAVKNLDLMSKGLPYSLVYNSNGQVALSRTKRFAMIAFPLVSVMAGAVLIFLGLMKYRPLDSWDIFFYSLKYSLPSILAYIIFSSRELRGKPNSARDMIFIVSFCITGFLITSFGTAAYLNGAHDRSPETIHMKLALGKSMAKSGKTTSYRVTVKSWRLGRDTETLRTGKPFFENVTPGQSVIRVATKPGNLGFEWIVSFEIIERHGTRMTGIDQIQTKSKIKISEFSHKMFSDRLPFQLCHIT